MVARKGEDSEALGEIFLQPGGEFRGGGRVGGDDFLEPGLGGEAVGTVEHGADLVGDGGALIQPRDVGLGVLLEMELAALPGDAGEHGLPGGPKALVGITDEQPGGVEAALLEAGQEGAPMDLGLTEGDADAQHRAFAIGAHADGDEHGAVQHLPALADFFIAGVEKDMAAGFQRAGAPAFQFGIQLGGTLADLGGADGVAAELLDDGGDFAGGDALDVHFGDGQFEGLFAAHALLEGGGIEVQIPAHLGDLELDGAAAGGEGFGLEAVGMAKAGVRAFIGLGLQGLGAFLAHGFIDEEPDAFGESTGAVFSQQLQNGVQEFRIAWVGHVVVYVGCVCDTPTGNQYDPPSTSFSRAERQSPSGGRLRSARYARHRSAAPRRGTGGGKKDNLQKLIYTNDNHHSSG